MPSAQYGKFARVPDAPDFGSEGAFSARHGHAGNLRSGHVRARDNREIPPKSAQIYALREIFLIFSKKFRFRCNEKAKNIVYIIYGIITGNICTPKGAAGARLSASARDFGVNPNRRCGRHMRRVRNPSEKLPMFTFRRKFLRRMRPRTELLHLNREFTLFVPFLIAKSGNLCYDII